MRANWLLSVTMAAAVQSDQSKIEMLSISLCVLGAITVVDA